MLTASWFIFFIPLIAAILIPLFFHKRPAAASWLATGGVLICFLLTLFVLSRYQSFYDANHHGLEASLVWMQIGSVPVEFGIYLNGLTLLMLLIVTGVGSLVFLFSTSYMKSDPGYSRYFACLSLFVFSMLGIVLSNNMIQIFIFWELVGLSSYLLIGFWFEKEEASTAGKKAFITTRVGDIGMMLGILALFGFFHAQGHGTFNFASIEQNLPLVNISSAWMTAICIGLFLGAVGKSAQVPLHVWLPDAMEGPTPVSALIHAATMVAAGIFLLARLLFIFEASPDAMAVIAWTGGITAMLAASIALVQNDIKKILAYSTLSQLGYMVLALGLANAEAGMFHLTTHAFFKALLFLGAGSLIHVFHTQDIRQMGVMVREEAKHEGKGRFYLFSRMPVTAWTFLLGTFALMGIPPLSGYFSKEEILAAASNGPALLFWLAAATVFLTAFYMGRLATIVFFPAGRASEDRSHHLHENNWPITVPLIILAVLSAFGGFFPIKALVLEGHSSHAAGHPSSAGLAILSISLAAAGFLAAFLLYRNRTISLTSSVHSLQAPARVLEKKYFFDDAYDGLIQCGQEKIARAADRIERYAVVEWTINGSGRIVRYIGNIVRKLQTGVIQFYAFVFAAGTTVIIYLVLISGALK